MKKISKNTYKTAVWTTVSTAALITFSTGAMAQADESAPPAEEEENVIVVSGIRGSLETALQEKRRADSLVEIIQAEDIGKLPDQNLAEVLENITGVQITRTAGVGTGVQIRGTNDNRVEINGVSTVGSGAGRGGINFEDINAAIISSVEVTKVPTAQTIEGSVGGTINLRTIRPLDLRDPVAALRVQGEYSELSDSFLPRISASYGNNWETGIGEVGIVLSGSFTQQEATSFRPRIDRDTLIPQGDVVTAAGAPGPDFDFLGIQFFNQVLENDEFETINFAGTLEWQPTDNLNFYFDAIINDQERRQDSSRVQGSGVSSLRFNNVPDTFETVNFGTLDGVNLGSIQASLSGTIQPNTTVDGDDPNLRFSSDVGARLSNSQVYILGTEFEAGRFSLRVEGSRSTNDTTNPNLSSTINFINPNPLTPLTGNNNDNPVPFIFDLTGGSFTFGIDFDSPFGFDVSELFDPANVVLDAVQVSNNASRNVENAFRADATLELDDIAPFFTSFDWGYRYNDRSSTFDNIQSTFATGNINSSPRGTLFADLLVPGPDNFDAADGRLLAVRNFILVDPDRAFSDQEGTLDILQAALLQTPNQVVLADPASIPEAFFDISETTHAVYGQLNFEAGALRGNIGLRWIDTTVNSQGNSVLDGGVVVPIVNTGNYQEFLPRVNLIYQATDNVIIRAGYTEDVNRPRFNDLSPSVRFTTNPSAPVTIGNPNLGPETVRSFDISADWFFAPSSLISVGFFHKRRTNIFVNQLEDVFETPVINGVGGFRDITDPCEQGGIFNPIADQNVFIPDGQISLQGICVPITTTINDPAVTTQTGIEVAFQYDLSQFEDTLGFASGFGIITNYTYQEFGGGSAVNESTARGTAILESSSGLPGPFTAVQGLLELSNNAYNITGYYEKYGISARVRYTWRSAFRTEDVPGGGNIGSTLGFQVVNESRGQLNASITYDINENINIGVEGVNLTKSRIIQSCVNSGALTCFEGLPDRRLTVGATLRF